MINIPFSLNLVCAESRIESWPWKIVSQLLIDLLLLFSNKTFSVVDKVVFFEQEFF